MTAHARCTSPSPVNPDSAGIPGALIHPERTVPDSGKPTVEELGIDVDSLTWLSSNDTPGAIEVAFTQEWVLMRVAGDPTNRVLVYDHHEWECFLDGAKKGEFDDAAS